ncbi:MFS transporter [Enterococcus alcedinis]|uniref:MFS transporter n=2 Tax=Enterococcus alcedinis TaxID=1274384 RepID=A0A917N4Q2_9ENTE|nr:MFS transporter [Enterococcus alcedinis]MBP2101705.1 fucose permease [Enterococcus alcedinis]GGI65269.1 MFS transporter [Enterococcus alcedinis]
MNYQNLSHSDRYILLCCYFIFFVNGLYAMVFGAIIPLISTEYQLSDTMSGLLLSGHQMGNLIAGLVAGILPVYYGRKKSILFLSSFVMVGFLIMIVTGNPILLLSGFFFTGISRGSISNFNNKTVNDISHSDPAALNLLHSIFAIGALISPFLVIGTTNLFGHTGWKWVSGLMIVLILISQILFSRMDVEDTVEEKQTQNVKDYSFFKDRFFWNAVLILFFYLCAESVITGWLVKYFIDTNTLQVSQAQLISSLLWLAILLGRLFCVFYGSRFTKGNLITGISFGMTIFYFLLLNSTNLTMILISITGLGFSMGGIYPTAMTIAGASIKKHPMAMGWILIIGGIGAILMPTITGILSENMNIFAGIAAVVVAIILMFLSVLWYRFGNEKRIEKINR